MADYINRELGWDDEISKESDFVILPEGDYDFEVTGFKRERHPGSTNLPACNKAVVTIKVTAPNGDETTVNTNLFLHSKCEGLLSAFFISIGLKKHGEPLRMNWNSVMGKKGKVRISIRKWTGKDGVERESNEVKRFLDPVDSQVAAASRNYVAGTF